MGIDKIRANVNVVHDETSSEESQEKYDPSVSALLSDQKSEDHANGAAIASGPRVQAATYPLPRRRLHLPSRSKLRHPCRRPPSME